MAIRGGEFNVSQGHYFELAVLRGITQNASQTQICRLRTGKSFDNIIFGNAQIVIGEVSEQRWHGTAIGCNTLLADVAQGTLALVFE